MITQTSIGPIHLSLVHERKIEWQDDTHICKPLTVRTSKGSLSKNYVLRPVGSIWEGSVSKPRGTFVPKWEDIQSDPEPDLRELLARKMKRKEAPAADDMPQCIRVRGPNGKIVYKL